MTFPELTQAVGQRVPTGLPATAPMAESQLQSSAAPSPAYPKVHWSRLTGLRGPKAQRKFQSEIRSRFVRNVLHTPTPSSKSSTHPPMQPSIHHHRKKNAALENDEYLPWWVWTQEESQGLCIFKTLIITHICFKHEEELLRKVN